MLPESTIAVLLSMVLQVIKFTVCLKRLCLNFILFSCPPSPSSYHIFQSLLKILPPMIFWRVAPTKWPSFWVVHVALVDQLSHCTHGTSNILLGPMQLWMLVSFPTRPPHLHFAATICNLVSSYADFPCFLFSSRS